VAEYNNNNTNEILITINHKIQLNGILTIPKDSVSIVIFSHGDGSNRNSPRNKFVAEQLQKSNIATLLVDLLSEREQKIDSQDKRHRFDISLISDRLYYITKWVTSNPDTSKLKLGYLGASTGAAAAINTAAKLDDIQAMVLRSGRPDLASKDSLQKIQVPTLMILGSNDPGTIKNNQKALDKMKNITDGTKKRIVLIPGGTHLLEEQGVFTEAAKFAVSWFEKYLV